VSRVVRIRFPQASTTGAKAKAKVSGGNVDTGCYTVQSNDHCSSFARDQTK